MAGTLWGCTALFCRAEVTEACIAAAQCWSRRQQLSAPKGANATGLQHRAFCSNAGRSDLCPASRGLFHRAVP